MQGGTTNLRPWISSLKSGGGGFFVGSSKQEGITMAKFQTQLVHGPVDTNDPYGAVVLPIYPATTYAYPAIGTAPQYDYVG